MDVSTVTLRMLLEHPLDIPVFQWALVLVALAFIAILAYVQMKDDALDLRWLIMDRPHRPSLTKIAQVVALVVSTWGFVVLTMKGLLTEGYFLSYMATWSGSAALDKYLNKGNGGAERSSDRMGDRRASDRSDGSTNGGQS